MTSSSQLFLLADHIKLLLLERQRAISLHLEPHSQDGHISRSLQSLGQGLEGMETDRRRLQENGDESSASKLAKQETLVRKQYDDLTSQFQGSSGLNATTTQANEPCLSSTFSRAQSDRPRLPSSSSFSKRSATDRTGPDGSPPPSKSVRFRDNSSPARSMADDDIDDRARTTLFPYRDQASSNEASSNSGSSGSNTAIDQAGELDHQQIHAYHAQVLREQDDQLDRLGQSIGRQRELSIQMGDELDDQVQLLDDVDRHVDRHQTRLDGARKRLGGVARRAKDNVQLTVIAVLIIVLIFLIVILKT